MGKSPAKWIKSVFFGKKAIKSHHAKLKEKPGNEKAVHVRVETPKPLPAAVNPPVVSSGFSNAAAVPEERSLKSEIREALAVQQDAETPGPGNQNAATAEQPKQLDTSADPQRIRQENAATVAQAAFRGYLARRTFKALKGIIRLQALIRGHLVRRQAVSTLYCMIGIVKLQAIVRGSRIRCSNTGLEVKKVSAFVKPQDNKLQYHAGADMSKKNPFSSGNTFGKKILAPSLTVMPLQVQYDSNDPNSVVSWLGRWSLSRPWKPAPSAKKIGQPNNKPGNSKAIETDSCRPKHSIHKAPSYNDSTSSQVVDDIEKPRRNLKKVTSNPAEPPQENSQSELEKVKCNLRKVQGTRNESSVQPEVVSAKPNQNQEKPFTSVGHEVAEKPNHNNGKPLDIGGPDAAEKPNQNHGQPLNVGHDLPEKPNQKDDGSEKPNHSHGKQLNIAGHEAVEKPNQNHGQPFDTECHDVAEKPNQNHGKLLKDIADYVSVQSQTCKPGKVKEETNIAVVTEEASVLISQPAEVQSIVDSFMLNETAELSITEQTPVTAHCHESNGKDENVPPSNEGSKLKDESPLNERPKSARRASFPAKQDRLEDGAQNTPKLPSYMAATESAKAKLQGQGSARFSLDGVEKNNITRRHSLPSSTNGKVNSASPRTQKPAHVGGKGGNRNDRSLSASRDGNGKPVQVEWRR